MPMQTNDTLLLQRCDVAALLELNACIAAVEQAFRWQGEGKLPATGILGMRTARGGLHVKAGILPGDPGYIVANLNTNFPGNSADFDLPTIQGLILICDAENGAPLALLDSIEVTIKRTAAATAVAAKYLARPNSSTATLCGCGQQGCAQIRAIHVVRPLSKIHVFDLNPEAARKASTELSENLNVNAEAIRDLPLAIRTSEICVTCTTARRFLVQKEDVGPGTFIAAVGADDEHKQEIDPALIASAKVIADHLEQCCVIGDTHHAIAQGLMRKTDVYAELSEIVAARKPGRVTDDEIIVFDSTGVAFEDAITAAIVYEKARAGGIGGQFRFAA
jgi:alanine dehydrogenase